MTFPWKRGDGHFMMTISVPLILNPIVKELRNDKALSRTISEYLWLRFGSNDIEADEAELSMLMKEKTALENKIREFESESISRRENSTRTERLQEITEDIKNTRRLRNVIKSNPMGRWQFNSGHVRLTKGEVEEGLRLVELYGSEKAFIETWDGWMSEKESLILEIGQKAVRKKTKN